jgi:hypothetical protein
MTRRALALFALALPVLAAPTHAQEPGRTVTRTDDAGARIAWFETWRDGLAAAQATNRPILLVAAAPQCHLISGLW